jgi:hypothetical protein
MKTIKLFLVSLVILTTCIILSSCVNYVTPDKYEVEVVSKDPRKPLKLRVKNVSNETFSSGLDFKIKLTYYNGTSVTRYATTSANFEPGDVQDIAGLINERDVQSWEIIEVW